MLEWLVRNPKLFRRVLIPVLIVIIALAGRVVLKHSLTRDAVAGLNRLECIAQLQPRVPGYLTWLFRPDTKHPWFQRITGVEVSGEKLLKPDTGHKIVRELRDLPDLEVVEIHISGEPGEQNAAQRFSNDVTKAVPHVRVTMTTADD